MIAGFYRQAMPLLADDFPANGFLLRGIGSLPRIPGFEERFQLKAAAIARYPMYRGLAQLIGMRTLKVARDIGEQFRQYLDEFDGFDYFFIHVKGTDMAGEDGDFDGRSPSSRPWTRLYPFSCKPPPGTGHHGGPFHPGGAEISQLAPPAGSVEQPGFRERRTEPLH